MKKLMKRQRLRRQNQNKRLSGICCCLLILCTTLLAQHPATKGRGIPETKSLLPEEASDLVDLFRHQRFSSDFLFEFELEYRPRRGKETLYLGRLWGTGSQELPRRRLELRPADNVAPSNTTEMILLASKEPVVWWIGPDRTPHALSYEEMAMPLASGVSLTPLDMMFSFLYWDDWLYLKSDRLRGHAAHVFQFNAPDNFKANTAYVQMTVHAGYHSLMKVEFYDSNNELFKAFNVRSFKKIDGEWIIKSIDYLDERTHDKTRFSVKKAAMGLQLPEEFFTPEWVALPPVVLPGRLKRAY